VTATTATATANAPKPAYFSTLLAGGAGTGKTVVALHRAVFLAQVPNARVLLCTFNRTLASMLEAQLYRLTSPEVAARIDVLGVDQAVNKVVRDHDGDLPRPAETSAQERLWEAAVATAHVPADLLTILTPEFLAAELRTVMLGMPALTQENYLATRRPGRGVPLNRLRRLAVWRVVEDFAKLWTQSSSPPSNYKQLAPPRSPEVATPTS